MNFKKKVERLKVKMTKERLLYMPIWSDKSAEFFNYCEMLTDSQVMGLSSIANRNPEKSIKPPRVIKILESYALRFLVKDFKTAKKNEKERLRLEYYLTNTVSKEAIKAEEKEQKQSKALAVVNDSAIVATKIE